MADNIKQEVDRLLEKGLGRLCPTRDIREIAKITLEINRLKKERNAIIPAHVYQKPEIILGIADFVGDSYKLAKDCTLTDADIIVFCGVRFMAETAKILNPDKKVFIPNNNAGCSLSQSITKDDVVKLKRLYPDIPVVTYINTSADVKSVSDIVVTSSSASKILRKLFERHKRVIFIPDKYMAKNLANELGKEIGKDIITWDGSCIVHERFDPMVIREYRKRYSSLLVLAHSECPSDIINEVDFMGSTSDMLRYIENTDAQYYILITECGLGELATVKFPNKKFIAMCRLCPYMKMIDLENVYDVLKNLPQDKQIILEPDVIEGARKSILRMFEIVG